MTVWVVMGNDYPGAVFASEEAAKKYIEKKIADTPPDQRNSFGHPRIFWRSYKFELQGAKA